MSMLEHMAQVKSSQPLANTTWSYTYLGATGTIKFSGSESVTITAPNGQPSTGNWGESQGSFWIVMARTTYIYLFSGTYNGSQGSGTIVATVPNTPNAEAHAFTMSKK